MLASKLNCDKAINWVEQYCNNKNASPTIILLEEWMMKHKNDTDEECYNRLINALRGMDRNDIADELEEMS